MTVAPYTGRCLCGAVTLTMAGQPVATRQCWCRQCQQIACGSPTLNAMFRTEDVTITGELAEHVYAAASGNHIAQAFCPGCGMHMVAHSSARPHFRTIRFGAIDEPHGLTPQIAIWTDEAPDWAALDPDIEQLGSQPVAPPKD